MQVKASRGQEQTTMRSTLDHLTAAFSLQVQLSGAQEEIREIWLKSSSGAGFRRFH